MTQGETGTQIPAYGEPRQFTAGAAMRQPVPAGDNRLTDPAATAFTRPEAPQSGGGGARIVLSVNCSWNVTNYRKGLIRALQRQGHDITVLAPRDEFTPAIEAMGCRFAAITMDNNGANPLRDAGLIARYVQSLRALRPDIFLGYTIKPNIYGSMAARWLGIPVINNITGLGTAFLKRGMLRTVAEMLYRQALAGSHRVFLQNQDDRALFIARGLVAPERTALLPGSGVNLARFAPRPAPDSHPGQPVRFLFVGRVLRSKGVAEFVAAANRLKREGHAVSCAILGFLNADNRSSIDTETMNRWIAEGLVDYLGAAEDVRPHLAAADCVVLATAYSEGTPRSLLEAAAMAVPIITTDLPGCRDVVVHGENGYLCRPRDLDDLTARMRDMALLGPAGRARMGMAGRARIEQNYDEAIVIAHYLQAIAECGPLKAARG